MQATLFAPLGIKSTKVGELHNIPLVVKSTAKDLSTFFTAILHSLHSFDVLPSFDVKLVRKILEMEAC